MIADEYDFRTNRCLWWVARTQSRYLLTGTVLGVGCGILGGWALAVGDGVNALGWVITGLLWHVRLQGYRRIVRDVEAEQRRLERHAAIERLMADLPVSRIGATRRPCECRMCVINTWREIERQMGGKP